MSTSHHGVIEQMLLNNHQLSYYKQQRMDHEVEITCLHRHYFDERAQKIEKNSASCRSFVMFQT